MPAYKPLELVDPVPGNIGLIDRGVVLLRFDEPEGVQPSDSAGNLDDLATEPGIVAPLVVGTWSGFGRRFIRASTNGLLGVDVTGRDTLLQKDATIQWLGSLTLTGATGPHTVYARGLNDGSISERYSLGLEIEEQAASPGQVDLRLFWQNSAGVIKTQAAGTYTHPGDGKEILFTVTRRWESTTRVVIRYYVNDHLLSEVISVDGDISGGTTARTSLGARKASGAWGRYLNGTIDEISITDVEISPDEIRHTYKRLTEYQPGGFETLVALSPPGLRWGHDPGNNEGRRMRVHGQGVGFAVASTEELRELWLPDRAPLELILRWEKLTGLAPKSRDSLDVRRTRIVAFLAREEGLSLPAMRATFAEILDANAADLQIIESTQIITDNFATLSAARWRAEPIGTWSIVTNELDLAVTAGADLRWPVHKCNLRTSLDTGGGRLYVFAKLSSYTVPLSTTVGLILENRVTGNAIRFGVKNDAGVLKLGYVLCVAGVQGAFVSLATPVSGVLWLRFGSPTAGAIVAGTYDFQWSTIGPNAGFTTVQVATGVTGIEWAGFGAVSTVAATATAIAARFDDFIAHTPDGSMPFYWYVFRDPLLPGSPDFIGANALAWKVRPANTYAAAIERLSCVCDIDPCDRTPLG